MYSFSSSREISETPKQRQILSWERKDAPSLEMCANEFRIRIISFFETATPSTDLKTAKFAKIISEY